jgi:hypothetical protein
MVVCRYWQAGNCKYGGTASIGFPFSPFDNHRLSTSILAMAGVYGTDKPMRAI